MNFTVAVKLAREEETSVSELVIVWCQSIFVNTVWRDPGGGWRAAAADPSILTLEIRYQRDQTYYGQAFGPTRNTLWAKVWT